jgi:hypothetical protein
MRWFRAMSSILSAQLRIRRPTLSTKTRVVAGLSLLSTAAPVVLLIDASRAAAQEAPRTRFAGKVITAANVPIPQVEVTVLPLAMTVVTDSNGRFVMVGLERGSYVVRFRRPGYKGELLSLDINRDDETKDATVLMEAQIHALPDVEVRASPPRKPVEYAYTHKYDGFFARQRVGLGAFISRADINRLGPLDTPRLVSLAPGVTLFFSRDQGDVRIRGCQSIGVWIDGVKQRNPEFYRPPRNDRDKAAIAAGYFLSQLIPSQVEMVEVYRGPAEMPADFLPDECAVVVWTR